MQVESIDRIQSCFTRRGKRLFVNPTYGDLLLENGLTAPEAFVALEGAIISGHPDRHVMRLDVGKVSCYLKREHRVPIGDRLNNFLAGFGFTSISLREARTLSKLARLGFSVPEWIAAGEAADGRAFLLIRDAGAVSDLRAALGKRINDSRDHRSRLATRLAERIAEIHNRGFSYPDLCAKHILVDSTGHDFIFLDWQRSLRRRLTWKRRCRDLALLDASLPNHLADRSLRMAFLLAYWRATPDHSMAFGKIVERIRGRSDLLSKRTSIREQRLPKMRDSQPLYWRNGEQFCVTELGRRLLEENSCMRLAYPKSRGNRSAVIQSQVSVGDDQFAMLTVRRTVHPIARIGEWLRGRSPSAPECRAAAQMLREERLGGPARLLAFGQRNSGWGILDSFSLALTDSAKEGCQDDQYRLAGLLAGNAKLASG